MILYIDDIRNPKVKVDHISRTSDDAIEWMIRNGCPQTIFFDHDLGGDDTSMRVVKWMIEMDIDLDGEFIPETFTWNVHSANPVGKANIEGYLKSYFAQKDV